MCQELVCAAKIGVWLQTLHYLYIIIEHSPSECNFGRVDEKKSALLIPE